MKKILMMLAVVACVASAQAELRTTAIRILADSKRSLSAYDTETSSLDKSGQQYIVKGTDSVVTDWKVNVTDYDLSTGYSVYLLKGTSYADVVATLSDWMTYGNFTKTYATSKYDDTGKYNQMYYAYNAKNDPAGANKEVLQLNLALDPMASTVAVFTYADADGKAQYNVISFDADSTGETGYAYYNGTASGDTKSTGWTDFAATIPEPTSGMLLLLGVAGLALKRKQK